MPEVYLIKQDDGSFLPAYDTDYEQLKRIKKGEAIRVKYSRPRNYKNHKRFFAMLNMVIHEMPESIPERYSNIEYLRYELMIGIGHCEMREQIDGTFYPVAKSMSFDKMSEDAFMYIYRLASDYLLNHFLPGVSHKVFNENVELFM